MHILVLNSGSSSQKCCLFEVGNTLPTDPPERLWEGKIDWGDGEFAEISIAKAGAPAQREKVQVPSRREAIERLLTTAWKGDNSTVLSPAYIDVVGHRVVHGGPRRLQATLVNDEVKADIAAVSAFAPLHNRAELEGMKIVQRVLGYVPQVAVFDTGFHRHIPPAARAYPGPYEWYEGGIHRYGFHGINHEYCTNRVAQLLDREPASFRLVNCHIGNGCSLAAVAGGKSVETTMGFTPLEGLMMGSRSGSVDPGILTYLMRQKNLDGEQLDQLLNKKSGLLGISGISGDVRAIERATRDGNERAQLAWGMYVHRLVTGIGAMTAALGGVDVLVFTAGVGENSVALRSAVCEKLAFLGIELDREKNSASPVDQAISSSSSRVQVFVIRAQEEWQIARECWGLKTQTPARS
jgi:acetate kinase